MLKFRKKIPLLFNHDPESIIAEIYENRLGVVKAKLSSSYCDESLFQNAINNKLIARGRVLPDEPIAEIVTGFSRIQFFIPST